MCSIHVLIIFTFCRNDGFHIQIQPVIMHQSGVQIFLRAFDTSVLCPLEVTLLTKSNNEQAACEETEKVGV